MLLSVCIPTYNRCRFIRLSARYWLEQLRPFADRVELIIVNNASTDGTAELLESYRALGSFRLVHRPRNLNFNETTYDLATAHAQGEYIWICGDDDYPNENSLAEVVAALEAHPEQDHFFVTTQFVPADHAPDLKQEDPRTSPHIHRVTPESASGIVPYTMELLESDVAGLTGFYASVWRRTMAIEALSGDFAKCPPFSTLESTVPFAVYVAQHRLRKSCYRIGSPLLTVVHTICWPQYAALFRLKTMPDLYALYVKNGVPREMVRAHQLELLDHWPRAFIELRRQLRAEPIQKFSFFDYLIRNAGEGRFWRELFRALWCDLLP